MEEKSLETKSLETIENKEQGNLISKDLPMHAPINKKKRDISLEDPRYRYLTDPQTSSEWWKLVRREMNSISTILRMVGLETHSFNWNQLNIKEVKLESKKIHSVTLGQYFSNLMDKEEHEELRDYLQCAANLAKGKNFSTHPGWKAVDLIIKNHKDCFE